MRVEALSVLGALELQRDESRAGPNGVNNEEGGHDRTDRQDPFYGGRKLPLNGTLIRIVPADRARSRRFARWAHTRR